MSDRKRKQAMLQMMKDGYREKNNQHELYLMEELRMEHDIEEFKAICNVMGTAGGLFSVPTLMAFSVEKHSPKVMPAILAITEIYSRINKDEISEIPGFFNSGWWRPRWAGTRLKFISYVFCITEMVKTSPAHAEETIDTIGEKLIGEISINLFPYETFQELRLCTPGWDGEGDVQKILEEVSGDVLVSSITKDSSIAANGDLLYEENLLNMRCDYLMTRLNFKVDNTQFRYLLKCADVLNKS
jgi:hypothetical protein